MLGSVLHLRRHILGCCSELSSCGILVPVPSMSFAYICLVAFFMSSDLLSFLSVAVLTGWIEGVPQNTPESSLHHL